MIQIIGSALSSETLGSFSHFNLYSHIVGSYYLMNEFSGINPTKQIHMRELEPDTTTADAVLITECKLRIDPEERCLFIYDHVMIE